MKSVSRVLLSLALCAFCVSASAQEESSSLVPNPGFEEPEGGDGQAPVGWSLFTSKMNNSTLSDKVARSGKQSLRMGAQKIVGAYHGVNFVLPVEEGEKYTFSAYILGDKEDKVGGSAHGMVVIEWKRDDGSEISRTVGKPWKAQGVSRLRWEPISLDKIPAPKGATKGVFGIHFCEGEQGGKGSIFVDDVILEKR